MRAGHPVGETGERPVWLTDHQILLSPEPASADNLDLVAGAGVKPVVNCPQFAVIRISMSLAWLGSEKPGYACALTHSACRLGYSASYRRLPRLLTELAIARADGRYAKLLASIAKTSVLVIDDWGVSKLSAENRRDLLEIIEDRHGLSSTIVTSQLPVKSWHAVIGDPTLADAILDRLVHSAYQLNLKGESMRKTRGPLNQTDHFTP